MWVIRELIRLVWAIVVAATIASVIGILIAVLHGGDLAAEMRISFLSIGCLLLVLAAAGNSMTGSSRRATGRLRQFSGPSWLRGAGMSADATPVGPTLTVSAVFVGSAIVLIALGLAV
jgi:hypothetical protein